MGSASDFLRDLGQVLSPCVSFLIYERKDWTDWLLRALPALTSRKLKKYIYPLTTCVKTEYFPSASYWYCCLGDMGIGHIRGRLRDKNKSLSDLSS